jgi:hypothetical protein
MDEWATRVTFISGTTDEALNLWCREFNIQFIENGLDRVGHSNRGAAGKQKPNRLSFHIHYERTGIP